MLCLCTTLGQDGLTARLLVVRCGRVLLARVALASALKAEAAGSTVRGYISVAADRRASVRAGAEAVVAWVSMPSSR